MNLLPLYETQKILDDRIVERHGLEGQDLLPEKILALQVELAELANEWRGFKFWSEDREPRYERKCHACRGEGNFKGKKIGRRNGKNIYLTEPCLYCDSTGIEARPLLEEYVDCLHFILSIGLDMEQPYFDTAEYEEHFKGDSVTSITEQFIVTNWLAGMLIEDNVHFKQTLFNVLKLGEMLGFTWEQIEQAYYAKNETNHTRQATGY